MFYPPKPLLPRRFTKLPEPACLEMQQDLARKTAGLFRWARANRQILPLLRVQHRDVQNMRAHLIRTGAALGLHRTQVELLVRIKRESREVHVPVPYTEGERLELQGTIVEYIGESKLNERACMTVKVREHTGVWFARTLYPGALHELGLQHLEASRQEVEAAAAFQREELQKQRRAWDIDDRTLQHEQQRLSCRVKSALTWVPKMDVQIQFRSKLQQTIAGSLALIEEPTQLRVDSWPAIQV